ncbi:SIMPL domain-containing protein [Fibrobacter succinogenes]|uniref:SIMPL domain-containing protein n=1 Tax=Fibrobacter succinogenes TaxID=833 RepID=UPI001563A273|nr:SIMPL domain-containing protein [Fibrobacter succinogenes]
MDQKTIRVMGVGNIKVAPDTTRLRFSVESTYEEYEEAYADAAVGNGELQKALQKLKLPKESLRTSDFSITRNREWNRDKGCYIYDGFKLEQNLALELPLDSVLTSKVIAALGVAWPELEVKISFIRKDVHDVKLQILESAVKDAREKAEVIASTLGHKLGGIVNVDYSKHRLDIHVHEEDLCCCAMEAPQSDGSIDYTPEDIEAGDTVETMWYLE